MRIFFHKMHGLGNDFIIIENFLELSEEQIRFLCDRNRGIGCDQLLFVEYGTDSLRMWTHNSDGSVAGFCGNGARCLVGLGYLLGKFFVGSELLIYNYDDSLKASLNEEQFVTINLGKPKKFIENFCTARDLLKDDENHLIDFTDQTVSFTDIRNRHIVIFVESFEFDIEYTGKKIQSNKILFPNSINVNFVKIIDEDKISIRTLERGAGLTSACGSGASVSAFTSYKRNLITKNLIKVGFLDADDYLEIEIIDKEIIMKGKYNYVFKGEIVI